MLRSAILLGLLLAGLLSLTGGASVRAEEALPRFTEEREAAAIFFVKKHLPDLMPFLEQLKQSNASSYHQQIREVFHITEMLADLIDDPRRYDLELKIWKTENRAHILVAQMSIEGDARKEVEARLLELAKELVDLDVQVLELKAEQLDKELGEINEELTRIKKNADKETKDRFDSLVEKANKRKK